MSKINFCGFAKCSLKKCTTDKKNNPLSNQARYRKYVEFFGGDHAKRFEFSSLANFKGHLQRFLKEVSNWNSIDRASYFEHFSKDRWENLSMTEQRNHKLQDCKICATRHSDWEHLDPTRKKKLKKEAKILVKEALPRKALADIKNVPRLAANIYSAIDEEFKKNMGVDYGSALCGVKHLQLQKKETPMARYMNKLARQRGDKEDTERQWAKNDLNSVLGTRTSFR